MELKCFGGLGLGFRVWGLGVSGFRVRGLGLQGRLIGFMVSLQGRRKLFEAFQTLLRTVSRGSV